MKILIADDDSVSRLVLEAALKTFGHDVTVTDGGQPALQAFQKEYFSVAILDWIMPDISGPELCRIIRQTQRDQYTYVILLTILQSKSDYFEGMDAGADDFIVKPFETGFLQSRLRVAERILGLRRHVGRLEGLLPICASCKRIRDGGGTWQAIETYIAARSDASFTHGLCPDCTANYFRRP